MDAAKSKEDEQMLHILRGVNNDLVAAKAKYSLVQVFYTLHLTYMYYIHRTVLASIGL